jgi:hypothetical protein
MRDLLDEAIGTSPPTRLDLDAIVARNRRFAMLRSGATIAVAGGTAAAIIAAIVAVNPPGRETRPSPGGVNAGRSASGQATPSPAPLPSRPAQTPTEIKQRLATTLTNQLTAALPNVKIEDLSTKAVGIRVDSGGGYQPGYRVGVRLTTDAGSGTLRMISAPRPKAAPVPSPSGPVTTRPEPPTSCAEFWAGSQTAPAHPSDRQCRATIGPQGQIVLAAIDKLDAQAIRYEVVVLWAESSVDLVLENYFEGWTGEGDPPDQTFLAAPQLTLEQLSTIAESPALGA